MFEEIFVRKTFNTEKALCFGFERKGKEYIFKTDILDNSFLLQINVSSDGSVDTKLIEKSIDEEYTLYKTEAVGAFVGAVREAIKNVLINVSDECFDVDIFKSAQTKEIIRYVREKFGDELEFLWKKSPENAIWRRKDTGKWYGALLTISASKLGISSEKKVEILNLHVRPENMEELLLKNGYYPGWHMNKKRWYTVILNNSVKTEEICRGIDESYALAKK